MPVRPLLRAFICSCAHLLICPFAAAQPDPSGIEFVTIGDVGNPNWTGDHDNNGRGSVGYEYKIGKFEVTTSQWVEFMNAAFDRPSGDFVSFARTPTQWSAASTTPINPGGQRWTVPAGKEMHPVGGISWRTAAVYCNWLHNGKSTVREAFRNGAYDVSTFGGTVTFTDQLTRNAGARYWIPSTDEWMKAAHWDPNHNGEGEGGWWTYSNTSDSPLVYGPPGATRNGLPTTANAAWDIFDFPGSNPFNVPLGAYSVTSPWGLFDVAGGTKEWTEGFAQERSEEFPRERYADGSGWETSTSGSADSVGGLGASSNPTFRGYEVGFRIASIPSPATISLIICLLAPNRRRRGQ